jgi:hypothetical protein
MEPLFLTKAFWEVWSSSRQPAAWRKSRAATHVATWWWNHMESFRSELEKICAKSQSRTQHPSINSYDVLYRWPKIRAYKLQGTQQLLQDEEARYERSSGRSAVKWWKVGKKLSE